MQHLTQSQSLLHLMAQPERMSEPSANNPQVLSSFDLDTIILLCAFQAPEA